MNSSFVEPITNFDLTGGQQNFVLEIPDTGSTGVKDILDFLRQKEDEDKSTEIFFTELLWI